MTGCANTNADALSRQKLSSDVYFFQLFRLSLQAKKEWKIFIWCRIVTGPREN